MGTKTYEEQVNEAISSSTKDESGKLVLPEGTSDAVAYGVNAEMRRRATQSELTKSQQELATTRKEADLLSEQLSAVTPVQVTAEQQQELDELKAALK